MAGFITEAGASYLMGMVGGRLPTVPNYYVALTTRIPSPQEYWDEIGEVVSDSYDRSIIPAEAGFWELSGVAVSNQMELSFPLATESWGDIWGWALLDDPLRGNVLFGGHLATAWTVEEGWQAVIGAGMISFALPVSNWGVEQ